MVKRKQAYSVMDKIQIITRIRKGEGQTKVAREMGIPESTVRGWLKDEVKLRTFLEQVCEEEGPSRKKIKTAQDPVLDKALYAWFVQERSRGTSISGQILKIQARKLDRELNGEQSTFEASSGWMWRFQKRHGISCHKLHGEVASADSESAKSYPMELHKFIEEEGLSEAQIYNADETGLYFRALPTSTLATKQDPKRNAGFKEEKQRLTALLCSNWSGEHKLKPLVIGKFRSPRCLHHINKDLLLCLYRHSKNAWMTAEIFSEWFHKTFVTAVRQHLRSQKLEEKAVLLLDNCPAHPPAASLRSKDGKIFVKYLPPNTTSLIQPMDQGIIRAVKIHYSSALQLAASEDQRPAPEFLKTVTVKMAIAFLAQAWDRITKVTVRNCFIKGLGPIIDESTKEDDFDFLGFTEEEVAAATRKVEEETKDLHGYVELHSGLDTAQPLTDDELLAQAAADEQEAEEEEEEEECGPPPKKMTAAEAAEGMEKAIAYLEQRQGNEHELKLFQAQNLLQFFKEEQRKNLRQRTVAEMFGFLQKS